ncbi:MAG: DNA primase [Planctomycetes bacterium]|nr:DNA primase [Planctomycetota bacterium]
MYSKDAIEEVRSRTDIVDVVGSYFPLRRSGANFKARCPFHEEKTPSFVVTPSRQTYHCFGCGARGGVFDFVMELERVAFRDALELLADKAGVTLEADTGAGTARRSLRAELYRVHEWVHGYFCRMLDTPEGRGCREYVTGRGINEEMIREFGIGYAPDGFTTLVGRANEAGYPPTLLEKAGLAKPGVKRPGHWSMFRDRLSFSIKDAMGRVVAFGARSLDGSEPKYLNSPETEIFQKGKTLFAIDRLRQHSRDEPVLVMEGYTDVIMSEQVGVKGAVATLGTALTPDHARVLSRYSERTVLVYDGDSAGLQAAERGTMLLLEAGHLDIKVAVLPEGQDPCDFFKERGRDGKEELLDVTIDLLDFLLDRSAARHDLKSLEGRRKAANALIRAAAAISDPLGRDLVLERVAERLRLDLHVLRAATARYQAGERRQPARRTEEPGEDAGAAPAPLDAPHREILEAVVNEPGLATHPGLRDEDGVREPRVRVLMDFALESKDRIAGQSGLFVDLIEESGLRDLVRRGLLPEGHGRDLPAQLEGALSCLKNRRALEEVSRLSREAVESGDARLLEDIQRRFKTLKGGSQASESTQEGSAR